MKIAQTIKDQSSKNRFGLLPLIFLFVIASVIFEQLITFLLNKIGKIIPEFL